MEAASTKRSSGQIAHTDTPGGRGQPHSIEVPHESPTRHYTVSPSATMQLEALRSRPFGRPLSHHQYSPSVHSDLPKTILPSEMHSDTGTDRRRRQDYDACGSPLPRTTLPGLTPHSVSVDVAPKGVSRCCYWCHRYLQLALASHQC